MLRILESGMVPLCGAQLHKLVDIEGQPIPANLQSGGCVAWAMMVPLSYVWLFRCVMLYCRVAWPWEMLTRLYVWLFRSMIYVAVVRVAILKHDIITLCAHAKLSDRVCLPVCLCASKYLTLYIHSVERL